MRPHDLLDLFDFFKIELASKQNKLPLALFIRPNLESATLLTHLKPIENWQYQPSKGDKNFFFVGDFEQTGTILEAQNTYKLNLKDQTYAPNARHSFSEISLDQWSIKLKTTAEEYTSMLENAIEAMDKYQLRKIVLSQECEVTFHNLNNLNLIHYLISASYEFITQKKTKREPLNFYICFYYDKSNEKFIFSCTPETLLSINDNQIETMSLAGTSGSFLENELHIDLQNDSKIISEHLIVEQEIENKLLTFCNKIHSGALELSPHLHLKHRKKIHRGELQQNYNNYTLQQLFDLIKFMHPTSAVAGIPSNKSQELISALEKNKRQHYAAPFGIITPCFMDLAVMLRCGIINNGKVTLRAGGGVLKNSNIQVEWSESILKMCSALSLFFPSQEKKLAQKIMELLK